MQMLGKHEHKNITEVDMHVVKKKLHIRKQKETVLKAQINNTTPIHHHHHEHQGLDKIVRSVFKVVPAIVFWSSYSFGSYRLVLYKF